MEALNFENILGEQDIETLFSDPEDTSEESEVKTPEAEAKEEAEEDEDKKNEEETTEVDPDDLFDGEEDEEKPESVGSEKNKELEEDASTDKGGDASPNNFYSSIASALAVDGIFPNLDEETVKKAGTAEELSELIDMEVQARFDEGQQRVLNALKNGVEPDDIRRYESTLNYIDSINDAAIAEESDKGEELRRSLIYQDFLNKGYSEAKARKYTDRTIDAGTDVEDAREALQSNREFFQDKYNELLHNAQKQADEEKAKRAKQAETLKNSILTDKTLMGGMEISNDMRKKVFDTISRPVYRDPETGEYLTAIQKYEMENRSDFLKYTGLLFTLTNGFKDFESFTKGQVKKEVKKGLRELERTINNTKRDSNGNLRLVTTVKEDPESWIGKGMKLDI